MDEVGGGLGKQKIRLFVKKKKKKKKGPWLIGYLYLFI